MIINPKKIIGEGIVKNFDEKEALQPNSIDLRIKSVREIRNGGSLRLLGKDIKSQSLEYSYEDIWEFERGKAYDVEFEEFVEVPESMMAFVTHRSSLNRIGAHITSGIYDSGFKNYIGAIMRCDADITIQKGTRIATIYFMKAESDHKYNGQYQGNLEEINDEQEPENYSEFDKFDEEKDEILNK